MLTPTRPALCARRALLGRQAQRSSSAASLPRRSARASASPEDKPPQPPAPEAPRLRKAPPTSNLYDPVASLSRFLTRRFGIVGGLSLFAVLAVTEGAEIVRALLEENGAVEVATAVPRTLPSGLVVTDTKLGAGSEPQPGDFLGMQLTVSTTDPSSGETVYLLGGAEGGLKRGGVREIVIPANVGLRQKVAGLPSGPSPFPLRVLVKLEEVSPSYAFS